MEEDLRAGGGGGAGGTTAGDPGGAGRRGVEAGRGVGYVIVQGVREAMRKKVDATADADAGGEGGDDDYCILKCMH
jgi:hypothetical protein